MAASGSQYLDRVDLSPYLAVYLYCLEEAVRPTVQTCLLPDTVKGEWPLIRARLNLWLGWVDPH